MAKRSPVAKSEREQLWRERLQRWKSSGQSVRAFCAAEGIQESAFYFWRRVTTERDGEVRRRSPRPQFVPVRVTPAAAGVEVMTANGRVVRVSPGFDAAHLQAILAALEASSC